MRKTLDDISDLHTHRLTPDTKGEDGEEEEVVTADFHPKRLSLSICVFRLSEKEGEEMRSHPFCSTSLGGKWRARHRAKRINDMGFMPLIHPHGCYNS